jgi:hypothetical protein
MLVHEPERSPQIPADPVERERWLDGIVPLAEGARLRKVHPDTLKREHDRKRLKLVRRSKRLWGIRRRDALMID